MSEARKLLVLISVGFLSLLLAFLMWRSVTKISVWSTPPKTAIEETQETTDVSDASQKG